MTTRIIETGIGTIEYSLTGNGIPLLFVHGGHCNCRETLFHKGFDTNTFCLITPSRPGYGQTPLAEFCSPQDAARLFISLLDKLEIEKVILVGISAGGLTAIQLAANYPNRISKLILISAVTKKWLTEADENYRKGKKLFSPKIEKYSWALFRLFYSIFPGLMAKTMLNEFSTRTNQSIEKGEVDELHEMISKQRSFSGFVNDLDQNIDSTEISKIVCPTLILQSLNDKIVKIEHATNAKEKIRNSTLKTYDNKWGHLLWLGKESDAPIKDTLTFIHNGY